MTIEDAREMSEQDARGVSFVASGEHDDRRLRRARVLIMVSLSVAVLSGVIMPGIGLLREPRPLWAVLGSLGILAFAVVNAGVLYGAVAQRSPTRIDHRWRLGFVVASAASVVLVAPVAAGSWQTWSWIGASIVGTLPLLLTPVPAVIAAAAVSMTGVAAAMSTGSSSTQAIVIIALVGASLALVNWGPAWLWSLIMDVRAGRDAVAVLAVTQERLRFAREVHDILGHTLSVIALKAELLERAAAPSAGPPRVDPAQDAPVRTDPGFTSAREAAEIRRLATSALDQVRAAVSGSRRVDLNAELHALSLVLEASGVQCSLRVDADVPAAHAAVFAPIAREAVTNVLRHSRASRCAITLVQTRGGVALAIRDDGAASGATHADPASGGLAGIRERLREVGGALTIRRDDGGFELRATIGVPT